ncbi:hypothetical protein [Halospeciosus flavus]|uniref:Uncharacterized protein n=1 Tax=Halospeciosus flavus TaxID=3032283 RepID=A0ABD5Z8H1_9EURY|nr:hypothetical protein [Halospeciosus flavus]
MQSESDVAAEMERVEEGDRVLWNGRSVPQVVTEVDEDSFVVEGNRGGHYRFFPNAPEGPTLTNLNSGRDWDVDDFKIALPSA